MPAVRQLDAKCVYGTLASETHSEARQRKLGELEFRSGSYEELFKKGARERC